MPDLFRIVTIGRDGRARVFADLQVVDTTYTLRDTLAFTAAARRSVTASGSGRWQGQAIVGEARDSAQISATLTVKGATPDTAAARVERILDRVDSSRRDLYIEWRPQGLGRSAYSAIRGPGSYGVQYRWVEWNGVQRVGVPISWPVAPLAQGLPCQIEERWEVPSDRHEGAVNLVRNPNGGAGTTGWNHLVTSGADTLVPAGTAPYNTPDPIFGNYGLLNTVTGAVGAGVWLPIYPTNAEMVPVVPGRFYAFRARAKIITPSANTTSGLDLKSMWRDENYTAAVDATIATTASNFHTLGAGAVIELTAIAQAPANARYAGAALSVLYNGAFAGAALVGRVMIAEVPTATSPIPTYGDGLEPTYRWTGTPHASTSVELSEAKLADYTTAGPAAAVERASTLGLLQTFDGSSTLQGARAHTARAPVPDGECHVGGCYVAAGSSTHDYFLSPGLRYRAEDGRYLFAAIVGANLTINAYNPNFGFTQLATVAHGLGAGGFTVASMITQWLLIRAMGDTIEAELHALPQGPSPSRNAPTARLTYTVDGTNVQAAGLGAGRIGYPMIRARAMTTGGAALVRQFDWHPYAYRIGPSSTGINASPFHFLPETFQLASVPGTAPALLEVAFAHDGQLTSSPQRFGLAAWARRRGRENMITSEGGDKANALDIFDPVGMQNAIASNTTLPPEGDATGEYELHSTASAANKVQRRVSKRIRLGRVYTIEIWAKTLTSGPTPNWTINRLLDGAGSVNIATIAAVQGWTFYRHTWRATGNAERLYVEFTQNGTASHFLQYAGLRFYEGDATAAPTGPNQTADRGAPAPFGLLQAENAVQNPAGTWTNGFTTAPPADPENAAGIGANDWRVKHASTGALEARLCYLVDPDLIAPPDFAGDTIDLEVYALGTVHLTAGAFISASTWHESDLEMSGRRYTREFGAAGRRLLPLDPTTSEHGYCTRVGTATIGRDGRWVICIAFTYTPTASSYITADALVVVPTWARASSPTGKPADATYPNFCEVWSGDRIEKIVAPDGSGFAARNGRRYPHTGIAGPALEVEPGDVDLFMWAFEQVPDDTLQPAAGTASGLHRNGNSNPPGLVRASPTPRYRLMPS